jgi:hypothetical protein
VEHEEVESFKDVDIEAILARVERRGPLMLARKRSLYRGKLFYSAKVIRNRCFSTQVEERVF